MPGEDDDNDWIIIEESSQWSGKIDLTFQHEEFFNLPGHGDIKAVIEQVGHTVHVFIEPVSKIEFSAKDIRSRIPSDAGLLVGSPPPPPPPIPEEQDSFATVVEESLSSEQSFVSVLQSPDMAVPNAGNSRSVNDTQYHSLLSSPSRKSSKLEVVYNIFVEELSIAFGDDCHERGNERDEFLRITLDAIVLSSRPEYYYTKTLKHLGGGIPKFTNVTFCVNNIQVDNQMFNRHDTRLSSRSCSSGRTEMPGFGFPTCLLYTSDAADE